jgi:hypothetical protein
MQDSLSGNCLTHLLACIYPAPRNCRECLSTLQFALRCANVNTSPVVNTITATHHTQGDANTSALVEELEQEILDLKRALDDTHAHYQKLLELARACQGDMDYGPIERAGDADAQEKVAASPDSECVARAGTLDKSSVTAQGTKCLDKNASTAGAKAEVEVDSGAGDGEVGAVRLQSTLRRGDIELSRIAALSRPVGPSLREQELQLQVRYRYPCFRIVWYQTCKTC